MTAEFNRLIGEEARSGLEDLFKTIATLKSNETIVNERIDANVSIPPTNAELDALFDIPSNIGEVFLALIRDPINVRYWGALSDPITDNWYTWSLTQAP